MRQLILSKYLLRHCRYQIFFFLSTTRFLVYVFFQLTLIVRAFTFLESHSLVFSIKTYKKFFMDALTSHTNKKNALNPPL